MVAQVFANAHAVETSVNGSATHTFPWRSREIVFINDSSTTDAELYIGATPLTFLPQEVASMKLWLTEARVSSSGPYRLWTFG